MRGDEKDGSKDASQECDETIVNPFLCQMKKLIHCTSAPCASIMRCTSGLQVEHPLKQWSCRRWTWMDRCRSHFSATEHPLSIAFSLWSTRWFSYNTGTQPIPHHSRTQRPPVLQLFPPHLLVGTQTWQVQTPREWLTPTSHTSPRGRLLSSIVFNYYTLVSDDLISSDPKSGQYTDTFKWNIKDESGKVCGAERKIVHGKDKTVSTSNLIQHQGSLSSFLGGIDWFDSWAFGLDYQALW